VARHKGKDHVCEVVQADEGLRYRVGGKDFNSPSSAGREVTGGVAVNGWRFWSLGGDPKPAKERKPKNEKPAKKSAARTVKPHAKKKGAKKTAKKKAARAASHASYGCGVCPERFQTLKAATKHAMSHGSNR
jgi:hypothetical protein